MLIVWVSFNFTTYKCFFTNITNSKFEKNPFRKDDQLNPGCVSLRELFCQCILVINLGQSNFVTRGNECHHNDWNQKMKPHFQTDVILINVFLIHAINTR